MGINKFGNSGIFPRSSCAHILPDGVQLDGGRGLLQHALEGRLLPLHLARLLLLPLAFARLGLLQQLGHGQLVNWGANYTLGWANYTLGWGNYSHWDLVIPVIGI